MNYGFVIDNRKCIGCHACTVACKAEHEVPVGVNRTWVKYIEKGEYPHTRRLFSVMRCNHCADAPCVEICPVQALYAREDGIVDFDNRRCIGCKACTQACPYDALYIDPETDTAAKCNYCAHRVDIGLQPACVNVCPEEAIISGDMDDPESKISQLIARESVQARKVEKGTKPRLFYIDGDAASLQPTAAYPREEQLQTQQATGVGHFASYARDRMAAADREQMLQQLVQEASAGQKFLGAASEGNNQEEKARRVYDPPCKGILWGWEVPSYVTTKAIASGTWLLLLVTMAFASSVSAPLIWWGAGVSLFFLLATVAFLIKDLDKPTRFFYVLLRPQWRSWLTRGGYAMVLWGGSMTIWGIARYMDWQVCEAVAMWASLPLVLLVAVYTAFLFGQARGRDFWQSPLLPLHMVVHAVVAGSAVLSVIAILLHTPSGFFVLGGASVEWREALTAIFGISLIANLVTMLAELVFFHPTDDARKTVEMIHKGSFQRLFWYGAVFAGNILPLLLLLFAADSLVLACASPLALVGIYITEHIWVRAPQLIPLS